MDEVQQGIGVIDSGVGGLTVAYELMRQLPNEKIIYLGDTLRCPYGSRSKEEVQAFTKEMVDFLLEKELKMVVIACNTATAYALEMLRKQLSIPVLGVIKPGSRAAIKASRNNHIGIIGTEGTVASEAYPKALHSIKEQVNAQSLACPLFVPMVEKGITDGEQADQLIEETLIPFKNTFSMDTLILGCTHYPLLETTIQKVLGEEISIISSSEETAREASMLLEFFDGLRTDPRESEHEFYATGDVDVFRKIAEKIFNEEIVHLEKVTMEKATI